MHTLGKAPQESRSLSLWCYCSVRPYILCIGLTVGVRSSSCITAISKYLTWTLVYIFVRMNYGGEKMCDQMAHHLADAHHSFFSEVDQYLVRYVKEQVRRRR